jgi:hypothetical protein
VKPLGSSRWEQHRGKDYYIDNRTGKRIDPYRSRKHIKDGTGIMACARTKTPLDDQDCAPCCTASRWHHRGRHYHSRYPVADTEPKAEYVKTEFKDWVQKVHEDTKSVTLLITENITKIADGETHT